MAACWKYMQTALPVPNWPASMCRGQEAGRPGNNWQHRSQPRSQAYMTFILHSKDRTLRQAERFLILITGCLINSLQPLQILAGFTAATIFKPIAPESDFALAKWYKQPE